MNLILVSKAFGQRYIYQPLQVCLVLAALGGDTLDLEHLRWPQKLFVPLTVAN